MKNRIISACICICMLCVFLNGCAPLTEIAADVDTTPEDYYIRFQDELYTLYYKDGFRINHAWNDLGELEPGKKKAVVVDADDPEKVQYVCNIRTYADDADDLFIVECGGVFEDRLLRKASADLPDYLDASAPVRRLLLKQYGDDNEVCTCVKIEEPDGLALFLQTVRDAAGNRDPARTIPVDRTSADYSCCVEFDGIIGNLYIGFLQKGTDGRWGFSSAEIDYSVFSDGYGLFPLPDELQGFETKK